MHRVVGGFRGTTLAGRDLEVPADLTAPTLLVFAYRQRQQRDVDTWLRVAVGLVGVLEVPVLARRWRPVRRLIDAGMASNADADTRQHTMCVHVDVDAFRGEVLGTTSQEVTAVLVDVTGAVWWHAFGPATDATAAALRRAAVDVPDAGR